MQRECARYSMDEASVAAAVRGEETSAQTKPKRYWWEAIVVLGAIAIFVLLALGASRQEITFNVPWMTVLTVMSLALLVLCGMVLWRRTRFS